MPDQLHKRRPPHSAIAPLLAVGVLLACGCIDAPQSGEQRFDLRNAEFDNRGLQLLHPGTGRLVRPEPDGLLVKVPRSAKLDEVGFSPRFGLHGDFEVLATYEILDIATPDTGYGVGPRIYLTTASEEEYAATMSRSKRVGLGDQYVAHRARNVQGENGEPVRQHDIHAVATTVKIGELGLRRKGDKLVYLAADGEGTALVELYSLPFTTADIKEVRVSLHRGGASTPAAARWKQLVVRAERFTTEARRQSWGFVLLLIALLAVLLPAGAWYWIKSAVPK